MQSQIKIEEQPKSQKQKEGSNVEFKVKVQHVQGTNRLSYQWFKDGVELQEQNNSNLILKDIGLRNFGCYACRVTYKDDYGETMVMTSRVAELDVIPQCLNGTSKYFL